MSNYLFTFLGTVFCLCLILFVKKTIQNEFKSGDTLEPTENALDGRLEGHSTEERYQSAPDVDGKTTGEDDDSRGRQSSRKVGSDAVPAIKVVSKVNSKAERLSGSSEKGYVITTAEKTPYALSIRSEFRSKDSSGHTVEISIYGCGTLIHKQWVLTSASYLVKENNTRHRTTVFAGTETTVDEKSEHDVKLEKGVQISLAKNVFFHPKFQEKITSYPDRYDFSLIQLADEMEVTDTVKTIRLSPVRWSYNETASCSATGFGNVLQEGPHKDDYHRKLYSLGVRSFEDPKCAVEDNPFLVSEARDEFGLCRGDYGASLICDGEIRGVFSNEFNINYILSCFDTKVNISAECSADNSASLFQDTCSFVSFINSQVSLFPDHEKLGCAFSAEKNTTKSAAVKNVPPTCAAFLLLSIWCMLRYQST